MKKFIRTIHLYLGLASGLIICIVCLTGSIMVFEKEILENFSKERYFVENNSLAKKLSLDNISSSISKSNPKAEISFIKVYSDPLRTLEVGYTDKENTGKINIDKGKVKREVDDQVPSPRRKREGEANKLGQNKVGKKEGGRKELKLYFVDPYTANVVSSFSIKNSFFKKVEMIHRRLLADEIGKQVVGVSVILFVFILITGIFLWWPKNKAILKQRLRLKLDGSWKRKNHDLHIVIGFYTSLILLVISITGLTFSYKWMGNGIYAITGTESKRPEPIKITPSGARLSIDKIFEEVLREYPDATHYSFKLPHEADESVAVSVLPQNRINENAKDVLYYTPDGRKVGQLNFKDLNMGHQIKAAMLPIHKGNIGGIPGKILAFICAIAGFTFPVTGVIMWLNRLKKEEKKSKKKGKNIVATYY